VIALDLLPHVFIYLLNTLLHWLLDIFKNRSRKEGKRKNKGEERGKDRGGAGSSSIPNSDSCICLIVVGPPGGGKGRAYLGRKEKGECENTRRRVEDTRLDLLSSPFLSFLFSFYAEDDQG